MSGNNPFAQWGGDHSLSSPSIYGALPLGSSTPVPYNLPRFGPGNASSYTNPQVQVMTFHFASQARTILNSALIGADGKKYFTIATHAVGNTVVINEQPGVGSSAGGTIEWQRNPVVALADVVARQAASQWLCMSPDKRYRSMGVRGQVYSWVPSNEMICLFTAGNNPSEFVARIVKGRDGAMVALDITAKAVHAGLLDVCVLAAVLFTSGRNFD